MKKYNIAVIGATGNVGRMVLTYLAEREFPVDKVDAFASSDSIGRSVSFGDNDSLDVKQMNEIDFSKYDFAFFCAGSKVSKKYVEEAVGKGCKVIDKSSFFRLNEDVPLIVPEANSKALDKSKDNLIANPNCVVIPLAVALKPIDNEYKIKRVVISTYQSVSGAGKKGMDELYEQTKAKYVFQDLESNVFPTQIAFNLFPQVGDFRADGQSEEEYKIEEELKKIIGPHIAPTVTCVRVPVFVTHSMSVNIEFDEEVNPEDIYEILSEADSILVQHHESEHPYTTPVDAVEHDEVFVSRIRPDRSNKKAINLWVACDNLRKGAALNAVQIAEMMIKN